MKHSHTQSYVQKNIFTKMLWIAVCVIMFTSCGDIFPSGKDDPRVVDAEILRIDVEPNPVKVGDTVTFTCVLKDSLAENLLFVWGIPGIRNSIPTTANKYSFMVDLEPGNYSGSVTVRDTTQSGVSPTKFFEITITD